MKGGGFDYFAIFLGTDKFAFLAVMRRLSVYGEFHTGR